MISPPKASLEILKIPRAGGRLLVLRPRQASGVSPPASSVCPPHPPTPSAFWSACLCLPISLASQHQPLGISLKATKDVRANNGAVSQAARAWTLGRGHSGDPGLVTSSVRRVVARVSDAQGHSTEAGMQGRQWGWRWGWGCPWVKPGRCRLPELRP